MRVSFISNHRQSERDKWGIDLDILYVTIAFVVGLSIGLLVMVLTNKSRMNGQRALLENQFGTRIATLEAERVSQSALAQRAFEEKRELELRKDAELERLRSANSDLNGQVKAVQATIIAEREEMEKKRKLLDEAQKNLLEAFKALSADALQKNNEAFLQLAEQNLLKFQEGAKLDLEARQKSIAETITPVKETLEKFDKKVQELDQKRAEEYGSLNTNISKMEESNVRLQVETNRLVTALRAPKVRGRWGEIQLRNVVEMAGMTKYCDYNEQASVTTEDGRFIPDMIVRLPNERTIVVDSKAPMNSYLEALECSDEEDRNSKLDAHASAIRKHVDDLGKKHYWTMFSRAPEFVIMFIPGEVFFSAALERDATLIEHGMRNNIILSTPTTLIALLLSVAQGWREQKITENSEEVSRLGRELYSRMAVFVGHLESLGRSLDRSVENFNRAIGSLDRNLLKTTQRFKELDVSSDKDIEAPRQIEGKTRDVPQLEGGEGVDPE